MLVATMDGGHYARGIAPTEPTVSGHVLGQCAVLGEALGSGGWGDYLTTRLLVGAGERAFVRRCVRECVRQTLSGVCKWPLWTVVTTLGGLLPRSRPCPGMCWGNVLC